MEGLLALQGLVGVRLDPAESGASPCCQPGVNLAGWERVQGR